MAEDHYVYMDGKSEAILLPSSYPTEFALRGAKRAFQRANPGRRVEVRCRSENTREE